MATGGVEPEVAAKMATEILVAYLSNANVGPVELPRLILHVRAALEGPAASILDDAEGLALAAAAPIGPTASVVVPHDGGDSAEKLHLSASDSIHDDYLVSFEDGKHYRSLRRHLMSKYGITPDQYRQKWGLPPDYPMVAPSYARERSEVAKRSGLGRGAPVPKGAPRRGARE